MVDLFLQAPLKDGQAIARGVVLAHADAGMVAVAVRDDGTRHLAPRIDVKVSLRAIQAFGS
jgi:hypothetical protein